MVKLIIVLCPKGINLNEKVFLCFILHEIRRNLSFIFQNAPINLSLT